jgi:hypothetical protein
MEDLYKCDECPATFTREEIIAAAKPEPSGFHAHSARVHIKDRVRHLLHCPSCDKVHFFGFDRAPESTNPTPDENAKKSTTEAVPHGSAAAYALV